MAAVAWAGTPSGTPQSRAALAACDRAEAATGAEAEKWFAEGLATAEEAIKADERDALAHFALFCNLGGQMRRRGAGVQSLFELRRLRAAIDRTLELAPEFPGAYAGKGALLLGTPRLLGGDPSEGERLLRRAVELDPEYFGPRLDLARALARRGAVRDARDQGTRALEIAERRGEAADVAAARTFLAELPP